jgi:hypothetical protein
MKLIIVESPTKAKTIAKFLGKGYKIESSFGHIRDLPTSTMGIDIPNNYLPKYLVPAKAKKTVTKLKDLAKKADEIILASDEDREGEAIAWHLAEALKLKAADTKRIVFHEITKDAILHALTKPRTIDMKLVDAQQDRRVLRSGARGCDEEGVYRDDVRPKTLFPQSALQDPVHEGDGRTNGHECPPSGNGCGPGEDRHDPNGCRAQETGVR